MCEPKLVRSLLILTLFYTGMLLHIKGVRAHSEEEDTPDNRRLIDQRQSGKYNIHVVIKNVAIIEMEQNEIVDENYNDGDYYYDEDDLTVKPQHMKTTTSGKPLKYTTSLPIQTSISPAESHSGDTTLNASEVTPTTNIPETSHRPAVDKKAGSKVKSIHAIDEQVLQRKNPWKNSKHDIPVQAETRNPLQKEESNNFSNSKVKVVRSIRIPQNIPQRERCRYPRGNCRAKRSSAGSILKRLFRMLLTLPFNQDEY